MKKTPRKKKSDKKGFKSKYEVVELPCDNSDMEKYVQENRKEINNKMVNTIEYAVSKKLGGVELFCFKNSSFVVVLHSKDFKESLENVFESSMNNQQFDVCARIKKIISKLDRLSTIFTYKKIKK
jgi:hypothetical protein